MTNAQIIFNESQRLAKEGIIGYTGRVFKGTDGEGYEVEIKETEPIHTFAAWKQLGYSVKKGEHAVAQIVIWKCSTKTEKMKGKDAKTGEIIEADAASRKMFMKKAHFFKASQVEEIKKEELPV